MSTTSGLSTPHLRDANITFTEEGHQYSIHGSSEHYISVTTFVHEWFEPFDAKKSITKMMLGRRWKTSKYYGKSSEEIEKEWEDKRNDASTKGTLLHKCIEDFYNETPPPLSYVRPVEFNYFLEFHESRVVPSLKPYRTEWMVYDEESQIAGSIDMVYEDASGYYHIYDWKRTAELVEDNMHQKGKFPLQDLPDTNYWRYCVQLNLYKYILEKHYGKKVKTMYLVCFHPTRSSYHHREVCDLQPLIRLLITKRKCQLSSTIRLYFEKDSTVVEYPILFVSYSCLLQLFYESHVYLGEGMKCDVQWEKKCMEDILEFYVYYHSYADASSILLSDEKDLYSLFPEWCRAFVHSRSEEWLMEMLLMCDFFQMPILQNVLSASVARRIVKDIDERSTQERGSSLSA